MVTLRSDYSTGTFKRRRRSNCYHKENPTNKGKSNQQREPQARKQKRRTPNAKMPKTKKITKKIEPNPERRDCLGGTGPIIVTVILFVQ